MADLISLHCPNCGRKLQFRSTVGSLFCTYCGTRLLYQNGGLIKFRTDQPREPSRPVAPSIMQAVKVPSPPSTEKVRPRHQVRDRVLGVISFLVALFTLPYVGMPGLTTTWATVLGVVGGLALAGFLSILLARKRIWFPVVSIVLTALAFYLVPVSQTRLILVITFGLLACLATLILLGTVISRVSRRTRTVGLVIGLVSILIVEAVTGLGLNTYADSKTELTATAIQEYYTNLAVLVGEGDVLANGYTVSGVTYKDISNEAENIHEEMLTWYDVPGDLVDYAAKVSSWADDISSAANTASAYSTSSGGPLWRAPIPSSFQLTMPSAQLDDSFLSTEQEIVNVTNFGDYAFATGNGEGLLLIAARLNAEAHWLKGISTSTNPDWIEEHLHFVEPLVIPSTDDNTTFGSTPILLTSPVLFRENTGYMVPVMYSLAVSPRSGGGVRARAGSLEVFASNASNAAFWGGQMKLPCHRADFGICPVDHGIFPQLVPEQPTYQEAPESDWQTAEASMPPLLGSDVQWPQPEAVSPLVTEGPKPRQDFKEGCDAQGGQVLPTVGPGAFNPQGLPPGENGWVCHKFNAPCWTMLSYAGNTYEGGDPGCPTYGLIPNPAGPVGEAIGNVGGFLANMPVGTVIQPVVPVYAWDGTYTIRKATVSCPGFDLQNFGDFGAKAIGTTFEVTDNTISAPNGAVQIGDDGKAVWSYPLQGGSISETWQFTLTAGGGADFTANASVSQSIGFSCSGTVDGTRTSK